MLASFRHVADFGLLVIFAQTFDEAAHDAVLALDKALAADMPDGALECVPALVNLMVVFDPLRTDHTLVQQHVSAILETLTPEKAIGREVQIDICYDAAFAPDLPAVAEAAGLSQDAVIAAHLSGTYHVQMFGFAPGYGYLSGVPDPIQVPRKPAAVRDVPAGSVIIAGPQCLITTLTMPTGWSIIGRSPNAVLTSDETNPTVFSVGDRLRFNRVSAAAFTPDRHHD